MKTPAPVTARAVPGVPVAIASVPAVSVFDPMLIFPNPLAIEPEVSAPTEVSADPVTVGPKAVASKTLMLLTRKAFPVARLRLPAVIDTPPVKVEVPAPLTCKRFPTEKEVVDAIGKTDEAVVEVAMKVEAVGLEVAAMFVFEVQ